MHGLINPREESLNSDMISSLWSRDGNLDNTSNVTFQQNHFVFLNVRDSGWRIAGKQKRKFNGDHLNEPPSSPQKKVFQPNISDLFKSRPLPKTISTNIETDPAPCGLANEKEKETKKPCVPSQSIPEDIPVTHTITCGVKPLETMNDEMKNTIITNRVPSKVINSHRRNMWTKKKKGF